MAKLIDSLQWFSDNERANALVLNRPLKQLAELIDSNTLQTTPSTSGLTLDSSKIDASVQDGDVVYIHTDGKFYPAVSGTNDPIGIYKLIDSNHVIVTKGTIESSGLITGTTYYLSEIAGELSTVGTIEIGKALSPTEFLVGFAAGSGSLAGTSTVVDAGTVDASVSDGDLVYVSNDGTLYPTLGNDIIKDKVIGFYSDGTLSFSGLYPSAGLTPGSKYYLSNSVEGSITKDFYEGAIQVGIALDSETLVFNIGSTSTVSGGTETGLNITNDSFVATAGQSSANIAFLDSVFIYSDGLLLSSDNYTLGEGVILFDPVLNEGEKIQVISLGAPTGSGVSNNTESHVFSATEGQTVFEVEHTIDAVDVYVNGIYLANVDYISDGESITLSTVCTLDDQVVINTYPIIATEVVIDGAILSAITNETTSTTYIATEGQTTFTLVHAANAVDVYIGGIYLSKDEYTSNGTEIVLNSSLLENEQVIINTYPIVATEITGGYDPIETDFDATEGQTDFTINYTVGNINIFVNGVKLRNTEFTATTGTNISIIAGTNENDWVQTVTW